MTALAPREARALSRQIVNPTDRTRMRRVAERWGALIEEMYA